MTKLNSKRVLVIGGSSGIGMAEAAAALAEGFTTIGLSAERLANFITLCCVVAWRVTRLSMLSRDIAGAEPATTLTVAERPLLELATTE